MTTFALVMLFALPPAALFAWWCVHRYWPRAPRVTLHARDMLRRDAQAMYLRLRAALPQYLIFARASLDAFVEARGADKAATAAKQAELARQTADFLICSSDFRVVAAVELEGVVGAREHGRKSAALLRAANIPVLRWNSASLPTVRDIQEAIAELETQRLLRIGMENRLLTEPRGSSLQGAGTNRSSKH